MIFSLRKQNKSRAARPKGRAAFLRAERRACFLHPAGRSRVRGGAPRPLVFLQPERLRGGYGASPRYPVVLGFATF